MVRPSHSPTLLRRFFPRRPLLVRFEFRTGTHRFTGFFPAGVVEAVLWSALLIAGLALAWRMGLDRRRVFGMLWAMPPSLEGFAIEVETRDVTLRIVPWPATPLGGPHA